MSQSAGKTQNERRLVIAGASLGTLFEWFDFFLYGALAGEIARRFFTGVDETTAFVLALAAFGAGFAARPLGALLFGRFGDVMGRKNTFLVTIALMGGATFLIGLLPDAHAIGVAAPILLVALRIVQGLALGGEFGGAAIYVAEHADPDRRGLDTSWIAAMASGGLILALGIIIACRLALSPEAFAEWGWRLPFLLSIVMLAISLWVRSRLGESPVFARMKAEGAISKAPYVETFGQWLNLKRMLAVFGFIAGGTCVFYTALFYTLFFLERMLKLDGLTANLLVAAALVLTMPGYLFLGWLSDRIGRKTILALGSAVAALIIFPAFHWLTEAANPALARAQREAPVVVAANPALCSVQFDPLNARRFDENGCDLARLFLARAGVSYTRAETSSAIAEVRIGGQIVQAPNLAGHSEAARAAETQAFQQRARAALDAAGYPAAADRTELNAPMVVAIVALLAFIAAMTYAPVSALMVELFPARIRYTSLSAPYHFATGWIGGFLPATAFAIVAATGDIYAGLWYPVVFATIGATVALVFLPETRGRDIN
ncbi:MAG: MFS transporter [Hyphomonadaceae bacterium]